MEATKVNMRGKGYILYCPSCGDEYSGDANDYWYVSDDHIFTCRNCNIEMELVPKNINYTRYIQGDYMEHIYIKDTITGRSLWITKQEDGYQDYYTMLTDSMLYREPIKVKSVGKVIRDWMRNVTKLNDKVEPINFVEGMNMELHEYTGEPTEQEIQQRLEFWNSWSPNSYKDNHLRIHHPCPCCGSDEDTEWVRQEWNICYNCLIAFTLDDLIPVYDPTMLQPEEEDYE